MEDASAAQEVKPCTALVPAPCTALVPLHYFHKRLYPVGGFFLAPDAARRLDFVGVLLHVAGKPDVGRAGLFALDFQDQAGQVAKPGLDGCPVRLALPAPARLLALPAPKTDPEPAPAPVPGPWKKCSFYTIRRDKEDDKQKPHKVDGYTDGIYNYYAIGTKSKTWYVIHPVYGLSIVWMETRGGGPP